MFNLNEDNRIVMAQHPTDMRKGVNTLCGEVRRVGLDPTNGDVYIFVGKSRKVMKLLHWEYGGYVVYYKRLEVGRFHPRIFLFSPFSPGQAGGKRETRLRPSGEKQVAARAPHSPCRGSPGVI